MAAKKHKKKNRVKHLHTVGQVMNKVSKKQYAKVAKTYDLRDVISKPLVNWSKPAF